MFLGADLAAEGETLADVFHFTESFKDGSDQFREAAVVFGGHQAGAVMQLFGKADGDVAHGDFHGWPLD